MNAITLLSGWSGTSPGGGSRSLAQGPSSSQTDGTGRIHGGDPLEQREHRDAANDGVGSARPGFDGDGKADEDADVESDIDPELLLKPPESQQYEALEAEVQGNANGASHTFLASTAEVNAYPSPPPTPPIPREDNAELVSPFPVMPYSERLNDEQALSVASTDSSTQTQIEKGNVSGLEDSHSRQQPRRTSERNSRVIARSFPVRCVARLYILLRRFLALFGVCVPIPPSIISSTAEQAPLLEAPFSSQSSEAPPSYDSATRESNNNVPATKPRWRFPGLGSKRRSSSSSLITSIHEHQSKDDTSSDSSTSPSVTEREKADRMAPTSTVSNSSTVKQRSSAAESSKAPSRMSVAQNALSKPKMLVLDLDETLIHSTSRMGVTGSYGAVTSSGDGRGLWTSNTSGLKVRVVEVVLDGRSVVYHVYKRPWVDFFLRKVRISYISMAPFPCSFLLKGLYLVHSHHIHRINARVRRSRY